ncbi:MAG: formylglycine-generating enzyme family protein, partial [Gordonia sp. (in: high G+C Gram-positive bacteria)]
GGGGIELLARAVARHRADPRFRMVALGDERVVSRWVLPEGVVRHRLAPLTVAGRRELFGVQDGVVLSELCALPAHLALARQSCGPASTAEELVDNWVHGRDEASIGTLLAQAPPGRYIWRLLAARDLVSEQPQVIAQRLADDPDAWEPIVLSVIARLGDAPAARADLLRALTDSPRGALIAAEYADAQLRPLIIPELLALISAGGLTAFDRERAGRVLATWGDPRDLDELVAVPGGTTTIGCAAQPNSVPVHTVEVAPFAIGRYPVTNGQYEIFVADTHRPWRSPDHGVPHRRSAPATDLTWHDANAYCAWLTQRWRAAGRITPAQVVRLPTEIEWERAARGDLGAVEHNSYPWGAQWIDGAANSEEAGMNGTCTVGIFPAGRSPFGVDDLAGQVWEWCSTLWGEDPAAPSFSYPYTDDGREEYGAGPSVRRVLRGGCFSSGRAKAGNTYRGSLEPDGFWRGNGFRLVVQ